MSNRYCRYGCKNTGLVLVPQVIRNEDGSLAIPQIPRSIGTAEKPAWEAWPTSKPVMTRVLCLCGHAAGWRDEIKLDEFKTAKRLTIAEYEQQYNPGWRRQLHEVKLNELNQAYLECEAKSPFREITVTQAHLLEHDGEDADRMISDAKIPLRDLVHYARQHPAFRHHGTLNAAIIEDILEVWQTERKARR